MYNGDNKRKWDKKLKIAIVYTTKGGTTRECAELLRRELSAYEVDISDMSESRDLGDYDLVVVGFPIRMAKPCREARKYLKNNAAVLARKKVAYYMCCGFIDCAEEYAEKVLPLALSESALTVTCLGGSLDPARFRGIDKFVVKSVRAEILGGGENGEQRDDMCLPTILDENIAQLADLIKKISRE